MKTKAQEMLKFLEMRGQGTGPEGMAGTSLCICPSCKHEVSHNRGVPCNEMKCPKCQTPMTGKGTVGSKVGDESKAQEILDKLNRVEEKVKIGSVAATINGIVSKIEKEKIPEQEKIGNKDTVKALKDAVKFLDKATDILFDIS